MTEGQQDFIGVDPARPGSDKTVMTVWINGECPKGHRERYLQDSTPLCSQCNYRRPLKPRTKCQKCNGTGQKFPGARRPCTECWGKGSLTPEFTEEESI